MGTLSNCGKHQLEDAQIGQGKSAHCAGGWGGEYIKLGMYNPQIPSSESLKTSHNMLKISRIIALLALSAVVVASPLSAPGKSGHFFPLC